GFRLGSGIASATGKAEIGLQNVPFVLDSTAKEIFSRENKVLGQLEKDATLRPGPGKTVLGFGPVSIGMGRPTPVVALGWAGRPGYGLNVSGEAEVSHALGLARLLGLPVLKTAAEGTAQMNLQIAGDWMEWTSGGPVGFSAPRITGTAQLRNVRVEMRGVSRPIEILSAEMKFSPDQVRVEKLTATGGGTHWTGSLALPRGCGVPGACMVSFNLNGDEIDLGEVRQWLGAKPNQRPWYQVLDTAAPAAPAFFEDLRASGKISAVRLRIRDTVAGSVSASLDLERSKLKISDLRADVLGGKHRGDWRGDFTVSPPVFTGNGTFAAISLAQVAKTMHDHWIDGVVSGTYQVSASGSSAPGFWQSADGTIEADMRDGLLPHVALANDSGPLQVERFEGQARLHDGKIEIKEARLSSSGGVFRVSGSASLSRELDLKLARSPFMTPLNGASGGYTVTGTLAQPRVLQVPGTETQAQLKR
ncbi:MAG: AsmA-like C-terminal region-containing protein, partial [Candidatus Sulfotelmatobacter sp.]